MNTVGVLLKINFELLGKRSMNYRRGSVFWKIVFAMPKPKSYTSVLIVLLH